MITANSMEKFRDAWLRLRGEISTKPSKRTTTTTTTCDRWFAFGRSRKPNLAMQSNEPEVISKQGELLLLFGLVRQLFLLLSLALLAAWLPIAKSIARPVVIFHYLKPSLSYLSLAIKFLRLNNMYLSSFLFRCRRRRRRHCLLSSLLSSGTIIVVVIIIMQAI